MGTGQPAGDEPAGDEEAPILSDGVVTLRPWSTDDAEFLASAFADPRIRRYNGVIDADGYPAPPLSLADAVGIIHGFEASWRSFASTRNPSGAAFAITDAASAALVGCCGIDAWSAEDAAQIGYWLAPSARGRGFATRATIVLTRWLFGWGAARVFLTVVEGNDASVAVARRAGFVDEGLTSLQSRWQGKGFGVRRFGAMPGVWTPPGEMNRR